MSDPNYGTGPGAIGGPGRGDGGGGFRRVLLILVTLGGVGVLTCGGFAFWALQQPEVREALEAGMDTLGTVAEAQNAPGAEELRAAGCDQAFVMDTLALFEGLEALEGLEGGADPEEEPLTAAERAEAVNPVIVCNASEVPAGGCDALAAIYLEVAGAPATNFAVQINRAGFTTDESCAYYYDPAGNRIGDFSDEGGE